MLYCAISKMASRKKIAPLILLSIVKLFPANIFSLKIEENLRKLNELKTNKKRLKKN